MNILSLFDGMSCGQIALHRAGIHYDTYYASEIDKYAIQITQRNYPHTIQLGDVRSINPTTLPTITLLLGGSPCQGLSFAGQRKGLDDPRSRLFFEYVRLLNTLRPTYFLFENVRMKQTDKDIITSHLGVSPIEIDSALVSAQSRKRLYWTNIPNILPPQDKCIFLKDIITSGVVVRDKSYCIDAHYYLGYNKNKGHGSNHRQIVYVNGDMIDYRLLTPQECEILQTVPLEYTRGVSNTQRYKMLGNGWTVDVIAHILSHIP